MIRSRALTVAVVCVTIAGCAPAQPPYDLVVANGRVDGSRVGPRRRATRRHPRREDRGDVRDAARRRARHRRVTPRRRARLHRPARARPAGRVVPHDGARRRHLGVRARGRHRRRRRVVCSARRRADRQLRRVGRPHPGADEGAGRSRQRPAAGRHRRQRRRPPRRRWRRWKRFCARGSRRARWPWASAAPTRPGAPMSEIERMFRVAAEGGASAHIHMRGGIEGLQETIAAAADREALRCTSCTSTRPPATSSTRFSPPSRPRATPDRT